MVIFTTYKKVIKKKEEESNPLRIIITMFHGMNAICKVLSCLLLMVICQQLLPVSRCHAQSQYRVKSLPYALSAPASAQYSGFLKISPKKFIHFYYFESENDPSTDPIVFWTNGGPGCSGLLGLFTEMGPWRPISNGSLARNPFSWTKYASMVFLEQPVGVGFSFTTDETLLGSFNDYRAANDNLLILKAFFAQFPTRSQNSFYLSAESYGGHYIPQWTLKVLNDPDQSLRDRFKGVLVGNPFTSFASGTIAMANVLWGLQLVPAPAW